MGAMLLFNKQYAADIHAGEPLVNGQYVFPNLKLSSTLPPPHAVSEQDNDCSVLRNPPGKTRKISTNVISSYCVAFTVSTLHLMLP